MSSLKDRLAAQRKAIADNKASFIRAYKFKVGKTLVRLMPGVGNVDDFARDFGAHYIKDATDKIVAVVGDAEICYGRACPVREAITQVIIQCNDRGDDNGAKKVKEWLAKKYNVVNLEIVGGVDTENTGKVVQAEFSENQFDAILSIIETVLESDPDWTMKDGILLTVEREGTGVQDTKYKYNFFPKQTPVQQAKLDQRVDLVSYVDGKFGASVNKALVALSSMLGRDVTQSAVGQALAQSAGQLSGPATKTDSVAINDAVAGLDGDDLPDSLLGDDIVDAEFEAVVEKAEAKTTSDEDAELAKLMSELDDL